MSKENSKHHILITGTGRTGTTFLVQLLTTLGLDTGFTSDFLPIHQGARAGLEYTEIGGNLPYILKNPKLMWLLPGLIKENPVVIDHILIPVRDINAAAESRRKNLDDNPGVTDPQNVTGGLAGVDQPEKQEEFFLDKFYEFVKFVSAYQIPMTFLQYPRLALDGEYLYHKIIPLFGGISKERFLDAFAEVSNPSLIHKYSENDKWLSEYDDTENIKGNPSLIESECDEIFQLRLELQQLRLDSLRKEKELDDICRRNETLLQQSEEIENIYNSHGWKLLSYYYKLRDKILPLGSRRRSYAQKSVQFMRKRNG